MDRVKLRNLALNGHPVKGLILLAWGAGLVGMADNVVRPLDQRRNNGGAHPALKGAAFCSMRLGKFHGERENRGISPLVHRLLSCHLLVKCRKFRNRRRTSMKSIRILFVVIIGLLPATTLSAQSQQSSGKQETSESSTQGKQGMMGGKMMGRCQAMMEERRQMQTEMKAMDAELDKLVNEMNNAPENGGATPGDE
jgi:hypothetical protein